MTLVLLCVAVIAVAWALLLRRRRRLMRAVQVFLAELAPPSRGNLQATALRCQALPQALAQRGWAVLACGQRWQTVAIGRAQLRRWLPDASRCLVLVDAVACGLLSPSLRQALSRRPRPVAPERWQPDGSLIFRVDPTDGGLKPLAGASASFLCQAASELDLQPAGLRANLTREFRAMGLEASARGVFWQPQADFLAGLRAAEHRPELWLECDGAGRCRVYDASGQVVRPALQPNRLGVRWDAPQPGCRRAHDIWGQLLHAEQWLGEGSHRRVRVWSWLRSLKRPGVGHLRQFEERVEDRAGQLALAERVHCGRRGEVLGRERWEARRAPSGPAIRIHWTRWQADGTRLERSVQRDSRGRCLLQVARAYRPDGSLASHRSWRPRRPRRRAPHCQRIAGAPGRASSPLQPTSALATKHFGRLPFATPVLSSRCGRRALSLVELLITLAIVALLSTSVLLSLGGASDDAEQAWVRDLQARMQADLDLAFTRAMQQSARLPEGLHAWDAAGFAAKQLAPVVAPSTPGLAHRGSQAKQAGAPPRLSPWSTPLAIYRACQDVSPRYAEAGLAAIMVRGGLQAVYLSSAEIAALAEPDERCLVLYDALGMQLQGLAGLQLFEGLLEASSVPSARLPNFRQHLVFRARPRADRLALEPFELGGSSALRAALQAAQDLPRLYYVLASQHFRAMGIEPPRQRDAARFDYAGVRLGRGQDFNDFIGSVEAWQRKNLKLRVEHSAVRLLGDPGDADLRRLQGDLAVNYRGAFSLEDAGLRAQHSREDLPEGGQLEIRRIRDSQGNIVWEEFHRPTAAGRSINRFEYAVGVFDTSQRTLVDERLRLQDGRNRELSDRWARYDPLDGALIRGWASETIRDAEGQIEQVHRVSHGTPSDGKIESWLTDCSRGRAGDLRAVYRRPDGSVLAEESYLPAGGWMPGVFLSTGWQYFDRTGQPISEQQGDQELRQVHWVGGSGGVSQLGQRLSVP